MPKQEAVRDTARALQKFVQREDVRFTAFMCALSYERSRKKMNYADARKLEKPKKVLSYENTFAKLECGHRIYFWRRNGKAPKNLLCAKCISERMNIAS